MTKAAAEPLPNLWDDSHAAGLDEPGLLLYRSNLLGSDLRITNFGGGNTSAKVATPDPLTKKSTEVLWVKGSGGDLGSMKRDGFATLYLDKLESLKGLYRGLAHEDEMVALFNHCTFDLNPRATSIDTPLHGFVPHRPCRSCPCRRGDRDRRLRQCRSADPRSLRRQARLSALAAAGLRPRPEARRDGDGASRICRRRARRPWPVHLGRDVEGRYETTLRIIQQAADWLAANEKQPAFGGARIEAARRREAPRRRRPADAADPRQDFARRAQGRPFHRRAGSAGIRQFPRARRAGAARHLLPRSFPAHQDPPARAALRSAGRQSRRRSPNRSTRGWRPIAPTMPPITSAASAPIRRRCAIPMR